jgi:type IV pilus assembly protein PilC
MPVYAYKAKNLKGESLEGDYESVSVESLEYMLREKGFFLVESKKQGKEFTLSGIFGKVNIKDIAIFCRQFSVIISSGITIVEAIGILRDQASKKRAKEVLEEVHSDLQKGRVLSEALLRYPDMFPEFMQNMVKVGEASGSLDVVLERLADYYENDNKIRRKVKSAMTYPAILGVLTVGVVILLMVMVLPMFAGVLKDMGGEMPLITRVLISISNFMVKNLMEIIAFIVLVVIGISYFIKTEYGKYWFDSMLLRVPVFKSTTVKSVTARFARSMNILLKSGIPIINAMEIMGDLIGNKAVERKFIEAREEIKEGRGISGPMKKLNIFPPLLIHMIAVGENTGELDEMLGRTAGFFDDEVEEAIEKLTAMIEPAMIIVMASIIGCIILSVMLPMINIMSAVQ